MGVPNSICGRMSKRRWQMWMKHREWYRQKKECKSKGEWYTLEWSNPVSLTSRPSDKVPVSTATSLARATIASPRLLLCCCCWRWEQDADRLHAFLAPKRKFLDSCTWHADTVLEVCFTVWLTLQTSKWDQEKFQLWRVLIKLTREPPDAYCSPIEGNNSTKHDNSQVS